MPLSFLFRRVSLKARLILSYLVILGIGGLATSVVGSWMVSSTIRTQVRQSVDRDLASARVVYDDHLEQLRQAVQLTASGILRRDFSPEDCPSLLPGLASVRRESGFDFLSITDRQGRVICRVTQPSQVGDDVSSIAVVRAGLSGQVAASTEIFSAEMLSREDPGLADRAYVRVVPTPHARPIPAREQTSGMVQVAAAPLRSSNGPIMGVLYGGVLLNHNHAIVDRVWEMLYRGTRFDGQDVGSTAIFQDDLCISSNVVNGSTERAVGTRAASDVYDTVVGRGATWRAPAWVVRDWYLSNYEPIRDYQGRIIGMLYVGVLEKAYTSVRDRLILTFFGIATLGFILIIGITYYMIHSITQPIARMVSATHSISAGHFGQEIEVDSQDEIGLLATSFNAMLRSLRQMRAALEEWGRTLEEKVKQRTTELMVMQRQFEESERLASIGMLAAGVAHEINNPLGGILALTALTLEDLPKDHPDRGNLEEVIKQTERCRDIVKGLLHFSRQSQVNTEVADVNRILDDTLSMIAKQSLFFNIDVIKELDPQLPPVKADRSQLQQVFLNILMNAVQAMDEKGTLTMATRRSSTGDHIEVLISDTGSGIPQEQLHRIFDPFFTTKGSKQGSGLGLAIVYGIIKKHGGDISVQSQVGKGSTFTIRMPVSERQAEARA